MSKRIQHTLNPKALEDYQKEKLERLVVQSNSGGGSYAALDPGVYDATLSKVELYDKRAQGKTHGWILHFDVAGLNFRTWVAVTERAWWKIEESVRAFDAAAADLVAQGVLDFDFEDYLGMSVQCEIGWQKDPETVPEGETNYKELKNFWAPVDVSTPAPAVEPEPVDPF